MALQTLAMSQYCRKAYCGAPFTFLISISFGDNKNTYRWGWGVSGVISNASTMETNACDSSICLKFFAYHYFAKALKYVKEVVVSGGLLQVPNK